MRIGRWRITVSIQTCEPDWLMGWLFLRWKREPDPYERFYRRPGETDAQWRQRQKGPVAVFDASHQEADVIQINRRSRTNGPARHWRRAVLYAAPREATQRLKGGKDAGG